MKPETNDHTPPRGDPALYTHRDGTPYRDVERRGSG